jgi:hypothetical protein
MIVEMHQLNQKERWQAGHRPSTRPASNCLEDVRAAEKYGYIRLIDTVIDPVNWVNPVRHRKSLRINYLR